MKKLLLAISTVAAFTGSAFAADMAVKAPPMAPPPPPPPTFTGCWLGGGIGYGLFDQNNTEFDSFDTGIQITDTFSTGGKGWLGRVSGGCDYQFGGLGGLGGQGIVIGGFADYDWTNISGRVTSPTFEGVGSETMNNQWAIGARIGWIPLPGLLTYVSGGYTQAHFGATAFTFLFEPVIGFPEGIGRDAATYHGWFIGGGEEYAFNWLPGLFWKTEYRFSEFNTQNVVIRDLIDGDPLITAASHKCVQTVTTSLVWRFNFGGYGAPVAARY
jgi:outer membrane immunogenic protein